MAERSFKAEVEDLRLGEGETFTGEGILALTKALHVRKLVTVEAAANVLGGVVAGVALAFLVDLLRIGCAV